MIVGFATLLVFQLAGEFVSRAAGLPVPGPVVGMAFLLAALELRPPRGEGLRSAAGGLLSNLSLLFVPAGVGVMLHVHRLADEWPALLVALLASTAAAVAVTGLLAERVGRGRDAGEARP